MLTTLTEILADWRRDLSIRPDELLVTNVALTGRESRNGYVYSEAALRSAVDLYDHKPVFLDHAADRLRPNERSTRDLVGSIVNPRFEGDRIRGDIRVLDTESGRTFLALAASDTPGVGMSHVVLAERSADLSTVERIHQVISVDAVVSPATTTTFRESRDAVAPATTSDADIGQSEPDDSSTTVEHSHRGGPIAEISHRSVTAGGRHNRDGRATERHDRDGGSALHLELEELRHREVQRAVSEHVQRLLERSTLPAFALTPFFRRQLEQTPTDQQRHALLEDRRQLLAHARRETIPLSIERGAASLNTARAFVQAIKGR